MGAVAWLRSGVNSRVAAGLSDRWARTLSWLKSGERLAGEKPASGKGLTDHECLDQTCG